MCYYFVCKSIQLDFNRDYFFNLCKPRQFEKMMATFRTLGGLWISVDEMKTENVCCMQINAFKFKKFSSVGPPTVAEIQDMRIQDQTLYTKPFICTKGEKTIDGKAVIVSAPFFVLLSKLPNVNSVRVGSEFRQGFFQQVLDACCQRPPQKPCLSD